MPTYFDLPPVFVFGVQDPQGSRRVPGACFDPLPPPLPPVRRPPPPSDRSAAPSVWRSGSRRWRWPSGRRPASTSRSVGRTARSPRCSVTRPPVTAGVCMTTANQSPAHPSGARRSTVEAPKVGSFTWRCTQWVLYRCGSLSRFCPLFLKLEFRTFSTGKIGRIGPKTARCRPMRPIFPVEFQLNAK